MSEQLGKIREDRGIIVIGAGDNGLPERMCEIIHSTPLAHAVISPIDISGKTHALIKDSNDDVKNGILLIEDPFATPSILFTISRSLLPDIPDNILLIDDINPVPFSGPRRKKYKPSHNSNKRSKKRKKH